MCPTLTHFCTTLTGIQQSQVSSADTFPVVLDRMWEWVRTNKYNRRMAVLTDGYVYQILQLMKLMLRVFFYSVQTTRHSCVIHFLIKASLLPFKSISNSNITSSRSTGWSTLSRFYARICLPAKAHTGA